MLYWLNAPERVLVIIGDAAFDEGSSPERITLARARAEAFKRACVAAGAPPKRLRAEIKPSVLEGRSDGSPEVVVKKEPLEPLRGDYLPDICEKEHYCWCDDPSLIRGAPPTGKPRYGKPLH